jgi:hypothetical protein
MIIYMQRMLSGLPNLLMVGGIVIFAKMGSYCIAISLHRRIKRIFLKEPVYFISYNGGSVNG